MIFTEQNIVENLNNDRPKFSIKKNKGKVPFIIKAWSQDNQDFASTLIIRVTNEKDEELLLKHSLVSYMYMKNQSNLSIANINKAINGEFTDLTVEVYDSQDKDKKYNLQLEYKFI